MSWAGFNLLTVDVAYYQGNYQPDGNVTGVIAQIARGNNGGYSATTWGRQQVANARAHGKSVGMYFFNGNLDAKTCGALFAHDCVSAGFNVNTDLVCIDCEDEGATGTVAWGPAQCGDFIDGFASVVPSIKWKNVLIYMNWDVNNRYNWTNAVNWGASLWYARPGGPLDQSYWPSVTMKQDGLYNGVDLDGHNKTYTQIIGTPAPTPKPKRSTDVAFFRATGYSWGPVFIVTPGYIRHIANPSQLASATAGEGGAPVADVNNQGVKNESYNYSLGLSLDQIIELSITRDASGKATAYNKGGYYVAPWLDVRTIKAGNATLTDAQVTALAGEVAAQIKVAPTKFKVTTTGEAVAE